jgi:hypothetical protein
VDFANQLAQTDSVQPSARDEALAAPRTATGLLPNKYPPGWALGSLPFFLAAHAFAPDGSTGFEPGYLLAVWLGQWLYAILGWWLAAKIVARLFPRVDALAIVLVVWLASPLVYYQSARLSMSHSQVFVLATAVFWLALRIDEGVARAREWALLGFCSALLVATRNVAIVYLLLPAIVAIRRLRTPRASAYLVAGALPPVAVQLLAWKGLYGSWLVYSYGGERFDFADLHLREIFFSARHGWFYWHPLLLPATLAFAAWAWRRADGRAWLLSCAAIALLHSAWPTWWLGSSFGQRGFEVPVLFAMFGWAALATASEERAVFRRALHVIAASAIVWNLALLALFLTQRIPRQEPVTYAAAARALLGWISGSPQ